MSEKVFADPIVRPARNRQPHEDRMTLSPEEFEQRYLADRQEVVLRLLSRHRCTWDLAEELAEQRQSSIELGTFRVGIVGVQNNGKSTLVNALLGAQLAPVSNSHLTTYVTYIEHSGEDIPHMLVEYAPESARRHERLALSEMASFVAKKPGEQIVRLRIRHDAELLRDMTIIDTPGLATRDDKSGVTERFLAEERSLNQAEKADAIVAVFPLVTQPRDLEAARLFGSGRLTGVSPINAVGVIERWNGVNDFDPDRPIEERVVEIARLLAADPGLQRHVVNVMPVNGALFQIAQRAEDALLEAFVSIARQATAEQMEFEMLAGSDFFLKSGTAAVCGLRPQQLLDGIDACLQADNYVGTSSGYPLARYVLDLLRRSPAITSPSDLRNRLADLGAIEALRGFLRGKFVVHRAHIRAGLILKRLEAITHRAVETCLAAEERRLQGIVDALAPRDDEPTRQAFAYLTAEKDAVRTTIRELTLQSDAAIMGHRLIDSDLAWLAKLSDFDDDDLARAGLDHQSVARLLGQDGWSLRERFGLPPSATSCEVAEALSVATTLVERLASFGRTRDLKKHLRERLGSLKALARSNNTARPTPE